jgi:putative DNA methylase
VSAVPVRRSLSSSATPARSLLEGDFPFAEVSAIARADRYSKDGVYAAHKWWARRPPAVIRALLLAATLPADTPHEAFWTLYADDAAHLSGIHIGDPFMGGATTLVEAARLGADVTGIDVDPLAVLIAREELAKLGDPDAFRTAADELLAYMRDCCGELYGIQPDQPEPLHFFYLRRVTCEDCETESLLYRTPVIARDVGKNGGVVRRRGAEVFCPDCRELRHVPEGRKAFRCCGHLHRLDTGTYERAAHTCPGCGTRRKHEHLKTGLLPRELIAVEETVEGERRRIRPPTPEDLSLIATADGIAADFADRVPVAELKGIDAGRPLLYGLNRVADLFTGRQQVVFASAFDWIDGQDLPAPIITRLRLGVSNALSANNLLCGYATDYGRLAPLFMGVRSYAMPVLSVELNPLHPQAGRGTLAATLRRVQRSLLAETHRHVHNAESGEIEEKTFTARRASRHHVVCQSADRSFPQKLGRCDAIVTDPPYFDFIAYSDLSLLYRAWLWPDAEDGSLGGRPIYPVGDDPVEDFATRLGRSFGKAASSLKDGGSLTFTFHSTNPDAWTALSGALQRAKLWVTAVFPVWTDARAAAHAHPGNCEWDGVFTCRPARAGKPPRLATTVEQWSAALGTDGPAGNDLNNLSLGLQAARDANTKGSSA